MACCARDDGFGADDAATGLTTVGGHTALDAPADEDDGEELPLPCGDDGGCEAGRSAAAATPAAAVGLSTATTSNELVVKVEVETAPGAAKSIAMPLCVTVELTALCAGLVAGATPGL